MRVLSLGAGVQSSAMLLMALEGRFGDVPDCAIFADTQWEPNAVYEWLDRLEREVAPFKIHRVTHGDIREDTVSGVLPGGRRFASMPFFLQVPVMALVVDEDSDEEIGREDTGLRSRGMGRRQCSSEYKVKPIRKWLREQGCKSAEVWIGISTDEAHRMKPADVKWVTHRWPLIDAGLNREACQKYLVERIGSPAPKSSCIGCPFHDDGYWARLKAESPGEFADAVAFDRQIRRSGRMNSDQFVHPSMIPLGDIKEFKHENQSRMFIDAFGNECEGVCGN